LRRRTSDAFVAVWDAWLQECVAASRTALGDRWLEVYLTSPAWRFVCAADACGPDPVAGVVVPSVDRVGRYFPLAIVARLPVPSSPVGVATSAGSFFDEAERLVIDTLAADVVDFGSFDAAVAALGTAWSLVDHDPGARTFDEAAAGVFAPGTGPWQVRIGSSRGLASALGQVLDAGLSALYTPLTLWWTDGSAVVESSCLILRGLPPPDAFTALLDGSWADRQWRSATAAAVGGEESAASDDRLLPGAPALRFRSAAATDVGSVRKVNQDSFLERTDIGLWAVADGVGGHSEGEIASRMVCDALADFVPASSFDEVIEAASARVCEVNEHLSRAATSILNPVRRSSTVVVLLTRGPRCAVLWAGDSRAYRWREGALSQLTRDHSAADLDGLPSSVITRAVGAEPTLVLDQRRDDVRPGDRFLLCSDGLTRAVSAEAIKDWMAHADIRAAADGLIRATLEAGAPDNVTAVVVEAGA
jgi:type VI secretion system protein ImpM